ncbi:MAG: PSD1 and planctomycete cytochrome C domain-containing protein [Pirellula sp.]|nr:PSD1 and planctomycete cytochrome C domain-containing protein [Pirellula sp.]
MFHTDMSQTTKPWHACCWVSHASHLMFLICVAFFAVLLEYQSIGLAQELPAQDATVVDFVRDIRPILERHCYDCHSGEQPNSSLRLDHKASAFAGGELFGNKIIRTDSNESLMIEFVSNPKHDMRMPPEGEMLSQLEIDVLKKWIDQGAIWPDGVDQVEIADPREHWSFKPMKSLTELGGFNETISDPDNPIWPRSTIDLFIQTKLKEAGLKPNDDATRRDWLRRVTLDLTGLPPSFEEISAFEKSTEIDSYEQVVDRLLASPRYGERAAQHWLDVVRYADTHGFEVNTERPNAWPYRDYIIEAFNHDTPYDSFVYQQLTGDTNGHDAATGFLVTASVLLPGQIGQDEPSKRLARQDALDEIVVNIGQTFLGLTIGCARCHNHKFDPISQADYFGMQAFVAGVEYEDRLIRDAESQNITEELRTRLHSHSKKFADYAPLFPSTEKRPPLNARHNIDRFPSRKVDRIRFTVLATNRLEPCIDELQVYDRNGINIALVSNGATVNASGSNTSPDRHELRFLNDGLFGNSRSWMSNEDGAGWVEIRFPNAAEVDRIDWGRDRYSEFGDRLPIKYRIEGALENDDWFLLSDHTDRSDYDENGIRQPILLEGEDRERRSSIAKEYDSVLNELRKYGDGGRPVFAGIFRKPDDIHLLRRGDPEQPQQPIAPSVPSVFGDLALDRYADEPQRRRALAEWITRTDNPLTARVMVNRIWQSHFGVGLVETSNDFGRNGSPPTHPELLDYLSVKFMESGWSIKAMHRDIVLSSTYRQSSVPNAKGIEMDADVKLLWRYPLRRLEGEALRDSLLASTGQLSFTMGGSGFDLFDKRGGLTGFEPIETLKGSNNRRMIYSHRVRRERDAVFGAYDCPDGGQSLPRRRESTTPIQALNLLNSSIVIELTGKISSAIESSTPDSPPLRIAEVYRRILGREPKQIEMDHAEPFVQKYGLDILCRALFNSNEYLYVR